MLNYQARQEKCADISDSSYALLIQRIGAAYNEIGDYLQAEKYVKKAIQIVSIQPEHLAVKESQLIRSYYLLTLIYDGLNNSTDKMQAVDSCIEISIRNNSKDSRVLKSLVTKVEYLFYIGDYQRAISFANEGQILTSQLTIPDRLTYQFYFLIWKVNSLVFLEKFNEAEKTINENINIYPAGSPNNSHAVILERLATVKTKTGNFADGEKYFNQSLYYNKTNKYYIECMLTSINMGYYLYEKGLGDYPKAIHSYLEALQFASKIYSMSNNSDSINAVVESFNVFNNLANVYDKRNMFDSAQYYFRQGLNRFKITLNNKSILTQITTEFLENKSIPALINALTDQGNCFLHQFKLTKNRNLLFNATALYSSADKLQYIIKNEQKEIQSQLYWRSNLRKLYENAIETAYLLGDMEMAFNYFEQSRAVLLTDQLSRELSLSKDEILKIGLVKTKINSLKRLLNNLGPSSEGYKKIQTDIFAYSGDLVILEQNIQKHNPAYLKAIEDTISLKLNVVQNSMLKEHNALFELFDGDSSVFCLLITSKKTFLNKIDKTDYEKTSFEFVSYLSDLSLLNKQFPGYLKTAKHLYDLIFDKVTVPDGRLIISPDGNYFPYEALVVNDQISNPNYFLEGHAVSYTYSARYLLYNISIQSDNANSNNFFGIAPVHFSNFNLSDLQGSAESLNKIGKLYTRTLNLTSEQAKKKDFLEKFPSYKLIQLYTHASETSNSGEPIIYFADSAVYLSDLISIEKTSSQLIVLSACETSNGKLMQGEGVFSFNRGFASLGIPATVSNIWSIDNQSTYEITEIFYQNLSKGMPIDVALQKAKLEFISHASKQKKLPFYWAAAILVGKTDAIEMSKPLHWTWIAIAACIFVAGILFFLFKRKNQTRVS